ncbi:hypothetical protein [Halorubrum sp. Atlit-26R]|jgi:hypothetical protein|uniref:hypothetical protein n=1 Tax=Halorubrum sp. Atlit-26R TaxID=2282128 RepID=UPI000EF27DB4|nr:hypothetical protein [Halorubrum sp. Atlit-26R]RLM68496.1 hypothetical protein DVK07_10255 [Halorubrum sp. Atlit-26R]
MAPETKQAADGLDVVAKMEQLTEGDRAVIDNGSWSVSGTVRSLDSPDTLTHGSGHELVIEREGEDNGPVEWTIHEDMGLTWSVTGVAVVGDNAEEWLAQEAVIVRLAQ